MDTCVACGREVPEGRMVYPQCEEKVNQKDGEVMQVFRPTRKQKELMKQKGLNPKNWYVTARQPPGALRIVNKETKTICYLRGGL
jgi:hypothetical protein